MSTEITRDEAVELWAKRKPVEAMGPARDGWGLIAPPGTVDGKWNASVFNREDRVFMFRFASMPVPHIRSWEMKEVPLLALVRRKGFDERAIILGASSASTVWITNKQITNKVLAEEWEHSIDGGKTWLHCGVEVTS